MSLPSKAIFEKDGEVVQTIFINCGWFTDGEETAVLMIQEMFKQGKSFPTDFDTVDIYENKLTKEEFNYIIDKSLEIGAICKFDDHDWNTDIQLMCNPPQYRCKKCGETIYVHAYNLLKLVGKC